METRQADPVEIAQRLAARFAEGSAERDADRIYPDEEMRLLKESGLMALFVPSAYGGLDADYLTATRVFAILAESDPNLAQITQAHHCGVENLKFAGITPIMDRYFPRVVSDGILIANAYTEVNTKTIMDWKVTLRRDGDVYRISGTKFYTTGSRWADGFFGPARMVGGDDEFEESELVIVWCDADKPGLTVKDDWDGMGQRTTSSGSVVFEDVPVDPACAVRPDPFNVPNNYQGVHAQILLCAIHLGIARSALRDALGYVRAEARPWIDSDVESATEDPYVLQHLGEMDIAVAASEAVLDRACEALEHARRTLDVADRNAASVAVARAKAVTTEAALRVTSELFRVCGTRSTRAGWNFGRHWRNIRTLSLHDPVDYKLKLIGDYRLNGTPPPVTGWN